MSLSIDTAFIQDTLANCLKELTEIQRQAPSATSQAQMDKPVRSLTGAIFDLDKTIGVLARLERQNG